MGFLNFPDHTLKKGNILKILAVRRELKEKSDARNFA